MQRALTILLVMLLLSGCGGAAPVGAGLSPAQGRSETGPYASVPGGGLSADAAPSMDELRAALEAEFARLGVDPARAVAAAPQGEQNAVFDLSAKVVDPDGDGGEPPTGIKLSWTEQLCGDYDQNGLVNYSDLTPIGWQWLSEVGYDDPALHGGFEWWPSGDPDDDGKGSSANVTSVSAARPGRRGRAQPGPGRVIDPPLRRMPSGSRRSQQLPAEGTGALNWRRARINGHRDALIEIGDVTPIGQHWLEQLSGFLVEHAVNRGDGVLRWDSDPLDLGHGSLPSAPRSLATTGIGQPVRYRLELPLSEPEYAQVWRVDAYDDESLGRGPDGNFAYFYPTTTGDTTPPVWVDTVGAAAVIPATEQLTVQFGTAVDSQSPPVSYRVYWTEGDPEQPDAPFDYEAASHVDVAAGPRTITGLTNDQYYRAAVRALDSADPPNLELNMVVRGHYAGPRDIYPPEWTVRVGIADLFYGNGMAIIVWDKAVDSHTDEHGTWESGPVTYRVYYGNGKIPDWDSAEYVDLVDIGLDAYVAPIRELDTTHGRWFAVRALDQATIPNEDANTAYRYSPGVEIIDVPVETPPEDIPADAKVYNLHTALSFDGNSALYCPHWQAPDGRNWATVYRRNGAQLEHDASYFIGDTANTHIRQAVLDDSGSMQILYTSGVGLTNHAVSHLDFSGPSLATWEHPWTESYLPIGFDLDVKPWAIVFRLLDNQPPKTEFEKVFGYLPLENELQIQYVALDEDEDDYLIITQPAMLSDGSLIFAEFTYKPSRKLTIVNDTFVLEDDIPPDEHGALYYRSHARGGTLPINEYRLEISSLDDFDLKHLYLHQGSEITTVAYALPLAQTTYGLYYVGDSNDLLINLGLYTRAWYETPEEEHSVEITLCVSDDLRAALPVGSVADTIRPSGLTYEPGTGFCSRWRDQDSLVWHYTFYLLQD